MANNDTLKNIIGVALVVCLVCSILVASVAVALKPRQEKNQTLEKLKNILLAGGLMNDKNKNTDIETIFSQKVAGTVIDLKTGERLAKDKQTGLLDPNNFDLKKVANDFNTSVEVPVELAGSGIKRVPVNMAVYFVKEGGEISKIILPMFGKGLWSTMYGFIALKKDLKTVSGFTYYEHGETPGLGGEVDNPRWKSLWKDKMVYDDGGKLILKVIKAIAPPDSKTEIDGLSGATITTRGIDDMLGFWLGEKGYYKPFLDILKKEGLNE